MNTDTLLFLFGNPTLEPHLFILLPSQKDLLHSVGQRTHTCHPSCCRAAPRACHPRCVMHSCYRAAPPACHPRCVMHSCCRAAPRACHPRCMVTDRMRERPKGTVVEGYSPIFSAFATKIGTVPVNGSPICTRSRFLEKRYFDPQNRSSISTYIVYFSFPSWCFLYASVVNPLLRERVPQFFFEDSHQEWIIDTSPE